MKSGPDKTVALSRKPSHCHLKPIINRPSPSISPQTTIRTPRLPSSCQHPRPRSIISQTNVTVYVSRGVYGLSRPNPIGGRTGGGEINLESIRILEEQIREQERVFARFKRTRNSLLNIYRFPPEVLGDIFCPNVTLKDDFDGLEDRSHNFLLVCHHWFEVASRTPEIWSYWGNTPKDWARWYRRSGSAPLDLVLGREIGGPPSDTLYGVLQDRATRDAIRRIHLNGGGSGP